MVTAGRLLHHAAMVRFECVRCGTRFTGPLRRIPAPRLVFSPGGHSVNERPQLVEPGTYFDDPAGSPVVPGAAGSHVFAPGDVFGVRFVLEGCADGCWQGVSAELGGNLACAGCGAMVGAHIDACGGWFETKLGAAVVRAVPAAAPEPARSEAAAREVRDAERRAFLGQGPGDWRQDLRAHSLWCQDIAFCVAEVVCASGGAVIATTGGRVGTLAAIAAKMLDAGRLLSLDAARKHGTAGAGRLLDAVEAWHEPGELTLLSFERSGVTVTAAAEWLTVQAGRLGRKAPSVRLVNVGPRSAAPDEGPVRWIGLPDPVWRYVERVESDDNVLAATRWRKRGLDAEVFRDEALDLEFTPADPADLASVYAFSPWILGSALQKQFDGSEPWMDVLLARLLPPAWLRPREVVAAVVAETADDVSAAPASPV